MNERIKEFAKQAGFYKYGDDFEDIIEKFAELIVFECTNAVMDGTKEGDHYAQRIEQHFDNGTGGVLHFGVEESKGWICPKCNADRTKIACPLGFGATVDGRCPMTMEAQ